MACYSGRNGALSLDGGVTNIAMLTSWTVSESVDTLECSYMGLTHKEYKSGLASWEGNGEALFTDTAGAAPGSSSAALVVGAVVTMVAYPDKDDLTMSYTGSVIITSVEASVAMDDNIRVSFAFQGTGPLTKDVTVV